MSKTVHSEPEQWELTTYQKCNQCKQSLPLSNFYKVSPKSGSLKTHRITCKDCANERITSLVSFKIQFIKDYKTQNPCMDCGNFYHYYAMDFDHVRGEKFRDISDMWGCSIDRIKEEIKKCDLVCATCHRLRTWQRKAFLPKGVKRRGTND